MTPDRISVLLSFGRVVLTVSVLYIGLLVFMFFVQEKLIFFPQKLSSNHRFSFSAPFEEHLVEVDGAKLSVLTFDKANAKGVILYFHGNAGSLDSWGGIHQDFKDLNFNLVIVDYRGYGKSTGKITSEKQLQADAERLYEFVAKRYGTENVVIYGRSIGTGIASWLAAQHSPKMLILETPYFSLPDLVRHIYPFVPSFLVRYKLRNDRWIQKQPYPVHLFHGTKDNLIPYSSSERLEKLGEHIRLHSISGAGHNNISSFSAYGESLKQVLSF